MTNDREEVVRNREKQLLAALRDALQAYAVKGKMKDWRTAIQLANEEYME